MSGDCGVRARLRAFSIACLLASATGGCESLQEAAGAGEINRADVYRTVGNLDLSARTALPATSAPADPPTPRGISYIGGETVSGGRPLPGVARDGGAEAGGEGYELNFEAVPVPAVAKAVLADILGVDYSIDPRVQGVVSLSSGRPIRKRDVLFALENALRMNNALLLKEGAGYRITIAGEAAGTTGFGGGRNDEPGFGLAVLPLRHVAAPTMVRLLEGFAARTGSLRADGERNTLLIQGTAAERAALLDSARAFDQDWMRGQSVGIYPVRNAAPDTVIAELEKIMGAGEGGAAQSLIKFQAVERLNAVLAIARKPETLRTAASWIGRLDHADTASTGIRVYRVRYGDAKQIAALLNDAFGGRGGGGDAPASQTAPGAGAVKARSDAASGFSEGQGQPVQTAGLQSGGGAAAGPFGALQQSGRPAAAGLQAGGDRTASLPARSESGRGQDGGQGGVHVTADTVNNSLLITANRENYRTIERTLRELDRPQLQVAIEATIAEVTLNNTLQYGVQTFLSSGDIGLKPDRGSSIFSTGANAILQRALPGFNLLLGPAGSPRLILDALRGYTDVKVVSSPSLVVLDNQAASLQVGDQVPIITRSATGVDLVNSPVVNNVDYRNTGVILRVIPRINANGNVLLDIDQEISNVVPGTSGSLTPTISQRKVKSTISVASGQTVMLGGLISERQNGAREGIPILERISFIGDFFAHNSTGLDRTELIIFIKPKIIRDGQDAQTVAEDMRVKILAGRPHAAPPALVRK